MQVNVHLSDSLKALRILEYATGWTKLSFSAFLFLFFDKKQIYSSGQTKNSLRARDEGILPKKN